MRAFAELFNRFPGKVMELLVEECLREQRPVFLLDTYETFESSRCECDWCDSRAPYVFHGYEADHFDPPLPNMTCEATCGAPECEAAQTFFYDKERGSQRRRAYKQRFGEHFGGERKKLHLERALSMILASEARTCLSEPQPA